MDVCCSMHLSIIAMGDSLALDIAKLSIFDNTDDLESQALINLFYPNTSEKPSLSTFSALIILSLGIMKYK